MAFPNSFLFSLSAIEAAADFLPVHTPIGAMYATADCKTLLVQQPDGGADFLLLIGYFIDIARPDLSQEAIARELLYLGRRYGVAAALAETDHLLGRFAVILAVDGGLHIFNDACATRSIYYSESGLISSHSTHIGTVQGKRPRTELYKHFLFGLPGNRSPYEGVRVLPPNFVLDMHTGSVSRYWPTQPRREIKTGAVIEETSFLLANAAQAISSRWSPIIGVTAGIDSRVSTAVFRSSPKATFFTYDRGEMDAVDYAVAREICRRIERPHLRVQMVGRDRAAQIYDELDRMDDHTHANALPPTYARTFRKADRINVRTNLAEIARAFWRSHIPPTNFSAEKWWTVMHNRRREHEAAHEDAAGYFMAGMAEYLDLLGYDLTDADNPVLLGYDGWDLFYWEHRMATWHAQVLLGSDYAFDTAIVFNCRRILACLLSAPFRDRRNGRTLKGITAHFAPELAGVPYNPKSIPKFEWA